MLSYKAGIRWDKKMCSRNRDSHLRERDGSRTELHGSGTGAGQLFVGTGRSGTE